jgi:hypothetical protein
MRHTALAEKVVTNAIGSTHTKHLFHLRMQGWRMTLMTQFMHSLVGDHDLKLTKIFAPEPSSKIGPFGAARMSAANAPKNSTRHGRLAIAESAHSLA